MTPEASDKFAVAQAPASAFLAQLARLRQGAQEVPLRPAHALCQVHVDVVMHNPNR